jgi:hypothetical protein
MHGGAVFVLVEGVPHFLNLERAATRLVNELASIESHERSVEARLPNWPQAQWPAYL